MSLCQYKDIFGKPGEGAHKHRFLGLAVIDLLGLFLVAYATTAYTRWPYWKSLVLWFIVAELSHWAFCVDTAVIKLLK